ncbi:SPOR domain-containing protein [Luteimonas suaedae]|uniref:SPOR domain-containing protein n=1 Tax=Luteimonas suaedae TaxID=2605430 RepID=UPI0011F02D4F|nr:SPOR domain-containing protein [Luteimonas suaedae]
MLLRASIVLLLALNLGVALWWALRAPPAPDAAPEHPAGVPRLQLLSEATPQARATAASADAADPQPETALAEAGEADAGQTGTTPAPVDAAGEDAATAPAQPARCLALGPFADADALATARARLQPQVLHLRPREVVEAPRGWRVMLPPLADRDAAQATVQKLVAAGFNDHFIIAAGEEANAIALGRFSGEAAARRHSANLRAAGFGAQAEPLGGADIRHWLDVAVADGFDVAAARTETGAARADTVDCAGLAEATAAAR